MTKTSEYLSGVVEESFKREVDLDESVWRTLPFFVAAFGLGLPLLGYISAATAAIHSTLASIAAYLLFGLSIVSFAWAFRWFWTVVAPLEYQYPPSDEDLLEYAAELRTYHEEVGLTGDPLDETVAEELRTFVTEQLAAATGKNRGNNSLRVQARSQAILFLMVGFGLAIASEAAMFVDNRLNGFQEASRVGSKNESAQGSQDRPEASKGANAASGDRGSEIHKDIGNTGQSELQGMSQGAPPPKTPPAAPPQRPAPPAPQILKKNDPLPPKPGR